MSYYYSNPEQLREIEMAVLEDQVVDHILEQAAVEVVPSSYSDVISGAAIAPEPEADGEIDETEVAAETDDAKR